MSLNWRNTAGNPLFIACILILIVVAITWHRFLLERIYPQPEGEAYTFYNNYVIFKQSYFHLRDGKDLYQGYVEEYRDYFKYSPTFSLLMAPLANLPDPIGLLIWNALNVFVLFFALWRLPLQTDRTRIFVLGFILLELITAIQNSQSNGLITGLLIFAFNGLEQKKTGLAALFIVLTIFIKLFGIVALTLFVFYPYKLKSIFYILGWTLLLGTLPLLLVPFSQLAFLYESWFNLLRTDHQASVGLSVAGWLHSWFGVNAKNLVLLIGGVFFCLPLLNIKYYNDIRFRIFFLSSTLIWIVIFNHKAESPSFVIAVTGAAIWFTSQKLKTENLILMVIAFILTVLSPTELFPRSLRNAYVIPYTLKAVPCILIWAKITIDLLFYKPEMVKEIYKT